MKGWIERDEKYALTQDEMIQSLIDEAKKSGQLEMLQWAMKVCGTGGTVQMIRKIFDNKFVEISGEGEKHV